MAAGSLNLLIEQGADFSRTLTIESTPGTPLDITGFTFRGKLRREYADANAAASFSFTITNGAGGVVQMTANNAVTSGLPAETLKYDVEMVSGSTVTRILEGDAWVSPEATK
jgi:hypothetical protein